MQVLFHKLLLLSGVLFSFCGLSQSQEKQEPVNAPLPQSNSAPVNPSNSPVIYNRASNVQEPAVKEKSRASEESETESRPAVSKKAAAVQETETVSATRMQQQFRINYANASQQYSRRSATPREQAAMDESVLFLKAAAPQAFETGYYSWLAGHYDVSRIGDLRKAEKLQPGNTDVMKQKAMYYSASGFTDSLKITLEKLDNAHAFTEGQLSYAKDLLASCGDNSTLIVHGFDDYLAASYVNFPRQTVNIISLDLLQSEAYRERCARFIAVPAQQEVNVDFLGSICRSTGKMLYLSMTIPASYLQPLRNELYVQGLTFVYSSVPVDTYAANTTLWSAKMNKLLLTSFVNDSFRSWLPNYKVLLSVLKSQVNAHSGEMKPSDYERMLRDIDNSLEIIQNAR